MNGEPEVIPEHGEFIWVCCDCDLTHLAKIQTVKGQMVLYTWRDDFKTQQYRAIVRKEKARKRARKK